MAKALPTGTVTFLFTDIEGSTKLAQAHANMWESLRERHHVIMKSAIESNDGYVFQIIGDAFCAAFHTAGDAIRAAVQSQLDLHNENWGDLEIKVRMGINTGTAQANIDTDHSGGYKGYTAMARVQRLMSAGHGGQVLISLATEELVRDDLPQKAALLDMGEYRLKDLIRPERIYQLEISGISENFPPLNTLDAYRHNLPVQLTSFVGRENEMAEISNSLNEHRLVTLTGVGGSGKTRLALQVSADLIEKFPDGVWFVQLATIFDESLVSRTTAIAIGLRDEPQRPVIDMLCDYLHDKKMLILLDNCEHLVDACAQLTSQILHHALNVHILISSRETLGIAGEVIYQIPPLELPDINHLPSIKSLSQYEAVKLFIDRATSTIPSFNVTNENAPAIAQICCHLDGLPLAIELAAVKTRLLSVEQISQRLDDRFRLLTGGSRTALERHQTLRAMIDWSYNLLRPDEKVLFTRLAVFVGGWSLEAAEFVCSDKSTSSVERNEDVLNLLEQLITKSLVIREEKHGNSRLHMLESLRQYANEKLTDSGKSGPLRDRHLNYFLGVAETTEPHLIRHEQLEWLAQLDGDYENLRSALEWAMNKKTAELSLRLCAALGSYWSFRRYWVEGSKWLSKAFAMPIQTQNHEERTARVKALYRDAELAQKTDDLERMLNSSKLSLMLAQEDTDPRSIAIAKFYVGWSLLRCGYLQGGSGIEAAPYLEQSLIEFQRINDPYWEAYATTFLASALLNKGEITYQTLHAEWDPRAIALIRKAGDRYFLAAKLWNYAIGCYENEQIDEAIKYLEEADILLKQMGQKPNWTHVTTAEIAWLRGDYTRAKALYMEYQEYASLLGEKSTRSRVLGKLGLLALEQSDLIQAQTYLDEALVIAQELEDKADTSSFLALLSHLSYLKGDTEKFRQILTESILLAKDCINAFKAQLIEIILSSPFFQQSIKSVQLLGIIDPNNKEKGRSTKPLYKRYFDKTEVHARKAIGNEAFEFAFAEGQKMSLDDALDWVLKIANETH